MNKTISLIAIVTGLALASCGSLQTISFEQLQAADVSFPDVVRNVAVVNNMPVYKAGDSHDVISVELKGDGKIAAEALAEEIANANYFEQVIICDSALRGQDTELREDVMLTQDEVQKLAADLGADLIFSFDRLDIQTKRGVLFIDTFDGGFQVDAVDGMVAPVIRIYIPSRERPMLSFSKQDTISWEIEPTLSDKKIVKEASEYAATMPVDYLLPHWREVSRFYFDGGNVGMRDAGVYVRENNWDRAFELWKQIYDKSKGRQKMRAAFNIGLYYEMKDDPATAIEWVEKADKLLQFKLKMGDEIRTVVSGIAKFYETPEELVGKKLVLVANLAPKKIRGIVSHGMLLSAATDDDSLLEVLQVSKAEIPSGSTVC